MKLACTALERVPVTRPKIIEHLMMKFPQDLVFCRAPGDSVLTTGVLGMCIYLRIQITLRLLMYFGCPFSLQTYVDLINLS